MKTQWIITIPLMVFATLASAAESTSTIVSIWETLISRPVTFMTLVIVTITLVSTAKNPNLVHTTSVLYLHGVAAIIRHLLEGKSWADFNTTSGIIISMGITAIIEIAVLVIAMRLYNQYKSRKENRSRLG